MIGDTIPERRAEMSPKTKARLAGGLLLATVLAGGFAQGFIGGQLMVAGDASATAANILAHEPLHRLAFAVYFAELACQIAMTLLFYELLRPVNKTVAVLSTAFGLIGCTVKTVGHLFYIAPLLVLNGAPWLSVFSTAQLQAVAFLSLRVNYTAETMAMAFFGLNALFKGYLVFRSTFLPRALGVVSAIGGLGWLMYVYEPLARRLQMPIVGVGVLGAFVTVAWLLVYGVDEKRWHERDSAARQADFTVLHT